MKSENTPNQSAIAPGETIITITHPEGCAPFTASVTASNVGNHIAAHDSLHTEAALLRRYMAHRAAGRDYDDIPGWVVIDDDGDSMTYRVNEKVSAS